MSTRIVLEQPGQMEGPGLLSMSPARMSSSRRRRAGVATPALKKGPASPHHQHVNFACLGKPRRRRCMADQSTDGDDDVGLSRGAPGRRQVLSRSR